MRYQIGQPVYDRPSKREAVIVAARPDDEPGCNSVYYELDSSVPLNPTGDNAFDDRWRCEFEICATDDPIRHTEFLY